MGHLLEHLTDIHHLRLFAAVTSGWVAVNYLVLGGMIIPSLDAPWRVTLEGVAFFVGCALSHVMIAMMCMTWPVSVLGVAGTVAMLWAMIAFHVLQILGGAGFAADVARARLVLRIEP